MSCGEQWWNCDKEIKLGSVLNTIWGELLVAGYQARMEGKIFFAIVIHVFIKPLPSTDQYFDRIDYCLKFAVTCNDALYLKLIIIN